MTASTGSWRWPTAALVVGLTGILGSAWTPNLPLSPPIVLSSPNGRSTAVGEGEQSAVATAPGMTPVPESSLCASTVDLAADAVPIRPDAIWPGLGATSFNASRTVSRHRAGCAARRPAAPDCTVSFSFTVQGNDEVVLAFALDRLVTGEAALAWLRSAVATCVGGRPGRLGGTSGLVGSVSGPDSPSGRARSLFVVSGGLTIWLVLDGGAWSPGSDRQAVDAAVLRLRSQGPSTIGWQGRDT